MYIETVKLEQENELGRQIRETRYPDKKTGHAMACTTRYRQRQEQDKIQDKANPDKIEPINNYIIMTRNSNKANKTKARHIVAVKRVK